MQGTFIDNNGTSIFANSWAFFYTFILICTFALVLDLSFALYKINYLNNCADLFGGWNLVYNFKLNKASKAIVKVKPPI